MTTSMTQRTQVFRDSLEQFQSEVDVRAASIEEVNMDFTNQMRDARAIKQETHKKKIGSVKRWTGILNDAGIEHASDLDDAPRRAYLFDTIEQAFEDGRMSTTSGGMEKMIWDLKQMLTVAGVDPKIVSITMAGVKNTIEEFKIPKTHTKPWTEEDVKAMFDNMNRWILIPTEAPSLDGKKQEIVEVQQNTRKDRTMTVNADGKMVRKRVTDVGALKRIRAVTAVAACLSIRTGELHSISWNDIDFHTGEVTWRVGKGKTFDDVRTARLPSWAMNYLREWKEHIDANGIRKTHLTSTHTNRGNTGPCSDTGVTRPFRLMCEAAGVLKAGEKAGIHRFRASSAKAAFEAGVAAPEVGMMLGHADGGEMAMQTYGHYAKDSIGASARQHWLDAISTVQSSVEVESKSWEPAQLREHINMIQTLHLDAAMTAANLMADGPQVTEMRPDGCTVVGNIGNIESALEMALKMGQHSADIHASFASVQEPSLNIVEIEGGQMVSRDAITGQVTHTSQMGEKRRVQGSNLPPAEYQSKPAQEALKAIGQAAQHCLTHPEDARELLEMLSIWGAAA